ncbi:MAG: pyrimidine reductase family protein [Actinomycetota bacterium]|nr:pyrimidine reductase family protein [Actinomycetota bacterium]
MRRLLPARADTVDLDEAYWVEDAGRQHVRAVMVSSVDGATQVEGRSGPLSSAADARLLAVLRGQADVVLAGATTVRVEGYGGERPTPSRRSWRRQRGLSQAPPIAVVTGSCSLDPCSGLFTDTLARPIVITHRSAPRRNVDALAEVCDVVTVGEGEVDIAAALDALAERGLRRVSCEGGPRLLTQVLAAGRLDEVALTVSPLLVAGTASRVTHGGPRDELTPLRLAHVLEDDGFLFLRYGRRAAAPEAGDPGP